jgi:predicted S18 family serine protease
MKKRFLLFAVLACSLFFFVGYLTVPSPHSSALVDAVAVKHEGGGVVTTIRFIVKPGTGKLLLDVSESLYDADTELSLARARVAAEELMGISLDNRDIYFSIEEDEPLIVSGASGGAAFVAGITAAVLGVELNQAGIVSAQVNGSLIAPVGGIDEKIVAAIEEGKEFFIIAENQTVKYEAAHSHSILIVRVRSLDEAVRLLLSE